MRIGALRVPSDDGRQYRRVEGLARGEARAAPVARLGIALGSRAARASGRTAGASARRHRRVVSQGCGAAAALHVTVRRARSSRRGHRLTVASPSYCLPVGRDGGARCTAPLHSACPPAPAAARAPHPRAAPPPCITRSAPKNFPHRVGKIDCAASPE
ncbi:jg3434 [Pararge aegeria aegeria]|uniref:Jg3434 protein n=1 Tax=Pararge aegeria aegeria TaxID=348720 RepID=A0A8S4RQJ7_9NEOP|nr:jg3434 [Pararge aegeria aegeria]